MRMRRYAPAAVFIALLLVLWQAAIVWWDVPFYILPQPTQIARALWELRGVLPHHFAVTLWESLLGLASSVAVGLAVAVLIHFSGLAQRTVYPLVVASQTIPVIALSPLLILWFGYGIGSKVAVALIFNFYPIVVNTVDGLRSVDPELYNMARTMGGGKRQIFFKIQLPSALPQFFTGLKIAATFSVSGATIGEWLGAEAGLGFFTRRASNMMQSANLFAAVLLLSVMGILLFMAAKWLERLIIPWHVRKPR